MRADAVFGGRFGLDLGGFPLGAHSPGGAGQNRPKLAPTEAIWRSLSRLGGLEVA